MNIEEDKINEYKYKQEKNLSFTNNSGILLDLKKEIKDNLLLKEDENLEKN